jgi:hypothetical protein
MNNAVIVVRLASGKGKPGGAQSMCEGRGMANATIIERI